MRTTSRVAATAVVVSALGLTAGCGTHAAADASLSGAPVTSSAAPSTAPASAGLTANMAGAGCTAYLRTAPPGDGSLSGVVADPVAVAAGHNPVLSTFASAVSGRLNPNVDLVDTLDSSEFTVFAPVDTAFAALPRSTRRLLASARGTSTLQKVLAYHVVAGQLSPRDIAGRTLKTVEGEPLTVSGTAGRLEAQKAHVICGGLKTANATVYLVDSVMMPPSLS